MKAQTFEDDDEPRVTVAMHVNVWDEIMSRLRRGEFVKGFALCMDEQLQPALGFVLDGRILFTMARPEWPEPEKGLN
jgi:hypothetical protein